MRHPYDFADRLVNHSAVPVKVALLNGDRRSLGAGIQVRGHKKDSGQR